MAKNMKITMFLFFKMLAHDLPICFLSAFKATDDEDDATTT